MDKILLIFVNNLNDSSNFDIIINDFEIQGYKMYLYDDVNNDSFYYTDLPEIIRFYVSEGSGSGKVVILSNIRDLIFFWYRCYNQLVDDFIYYVEETEVNFFDVSNSYYSAYFNIFEFYQIETETIEGTIYLTNKDNTIFPLFYKPRYFQDYKYFDFNRVSDKDTINKTYELESFTFEFNLFDTSKREIINIHKINKRIMFFKGISGYDVLRVITDYYVDFFESLGFETVVIDLKNNDLSILNEKLIQKKPIFVYSANCIFIDLKTTDNNNLFEACDIPFLGTLGDHPVNQYARIKQAPQKTLFTCLDRENILYLNKYFPNKKIDTNYALAFKGKNYIDKSFNEREIDILFIGTLQEPESIYDTLKTYDPVYLTVVKNVCDKILSNNMMLNIDDELEAYVCHYNLTEYIRVFLHSTIERYIRIYKRYHLVKWLGETGLHVVCVGNKEIYNKLNVSGNLRIRENLNFEEMLDLLNNCKVLINMTGHLYDGVTERILSAMLNGAAVATERDIFTTSNFKHNENIILYDFNRMDLLMDDINSYLVNVEKLEMLALNGQKAAKEYDYRAGAVKFPRLMRNFDENFNKEISTTKTILPNINLYKEYINAIYENSKFNKNRQFSDVFEKRLAEHLGVKNLLFVPNSAVAMQIACKLLNIKGEVITTPLNEENTKCSLIWSGLNPVYVDIEKETLNIDVLQIENKITAKTSCIVTNHCHGNVCNVDGIMDLASKCNVEVMFDATHVFDMTFKGNSILTQGKISFVNLGATQYFGCLEGTLLVINDDDLFQKMQTSTNNLCMNTKMSEFQASMGLCILDDIKKMQYKKSYLYRKYYYELIDNFTIPEHDINNMYYGNFPVLFKSEGDLLKSQKILEQNNIITDTYSIPLVNNLDNCNTSDVPNAYDIAKKMLFLPINEEMTENDVLNIVYLLKKA